MSQLILSGFGYTRRQLERLQRGQDWDACGVLQLAFDAEAERQGKLAGAFDHDLLHALQRTEAEAVAGVALPAGGLFYPEGGCPPACPVPAAVAAPWYPAGDPPGSHRAAQSG